MKEYEIKAKREMKFGTTVKQPGELIGTVKYEEDVAAEFFPHAFNSDLVICYPAGAQSNPDAESVELPPH